MWGRQEGITIHLGLNAFPCLTYAQAWSLSQPASRGRSNGTIAAAGAAAGGGLLLAPKPASLKEYK